MGPVVPLVHANFETWSGPNTVYVVNDNNGSLFSFEQMSGETWMTRNAVSKVSPNWNPTAAAAGPDLRALAAITPTDVMIAGIHRWPTGLFADPLQVEGRAALYSFGFMLRRTAAVRLDVSDSELKIGLRTTIDPADPTGTVIGQIFISDTLENGAGYSTYLGNSVEFEGLLRSISGPDVLVAFPQEPSLRIMAPPAKPPAMIACEIIATLHITASSTGGSGSTWHGWRLTPPLL